MNKEQRTLAIQILLFALTIVTTIMAGIEWVHGREWIVLSEQGISIYNLFTSETMKSGITYACAFLGILTVHELGHYFTAKYYKVEVTLPYYIPMIFSIGTLGAFIRIKQAINSRKEYFDIGIAGPLAGFIAAFGLLCYGFTHLPAPEYIFSIHPEYQKYGLDYAKYVYTGPKGIYLGKNLIFWLFENYIADPSLVPNQYEMMHYPLLLAGYLSCFFTALNLMPIGQLDGGHVLYGLAGEKLHAKIASVVFLLFVSYAGIGLVTPAKLVLGLNNSDLIFLMLMFYSLSKLFPTFKNHILAFLTILALQLGISYILPDFSGYNGWLVFAFILGRFLGINHPKAHFDEPLDWKRKALGWVALLIFILCFTPTPFVFE